MLGRVSKLTHSELCFRRSWRRLSLKLERTTAIILKLQIFEPYTPFFETKTGIGARVWSCHSVPGDDCSYDSHDLIAFFIARKNQMDLDRTFKKHILGQNCLKQPENVNFKFALLIASRHSYHKNTHCQFPQLK